MRKKKDNLSKIRLPEKYNRDKVYWLRDLPERIRIQRRAENAERKKTLEEMKRPPEPGRGLDGYPLQAGKSVRG